MILEDRDVLPHLARSGHPRDGNPLRLGKDVVPSNGTSCMLHVRVLVSPIKSGTYGFLESNRVSESYFGAIGIGRGYRRFAAAMIACRRGHRRLPPRGMGRRRVKKQQAVANTLAWTGPSSPA